MRSEQEGTAFLHELAGQKYIRFNEVADGPQWDVFFLTTKCWEKVENLQQADEIHDRSKDGNTSMEWGVFICHASEDKVDFVEPLTNALKEAGIKVWYDRFELKLGDSLRDKIDEGLANSLYGVVVLSSSFFKKEWPKTELDALVSRQNEDGKKLILPIWHGVGIKEVRKFSPILASKLAAQSSESLESIVDQIKNVLNENSTPKKTAKDKGESTETELDSEIPIRELLIMNILAAKNEQSEVAILDYLKENGMSNLDCHAAISSLTEKGFIRQTNTSPVSYNISPRGYQWAMQNKNLFDQLNAEALSDEAKKMLLKAAQGDGVIIKAHNMRERRIQINSENIISSQDPRTVAKWEGALDELEENDFIKDKGHKGEVFGVTNKGYKYADKINREI